MALHSSVGYLFYILLLYQLVIYIKIDYIINKTVFGNFFFWLIIGDNFNKLLFFYWNLEQ